jgi:Xaa-Pro aminopeptidase/Xaa-Pro dipeptidase
VNHDRIRRLQSALTDSGAACALIVPGPNLFYLTGLRMGMSERVTLAIIPTQGEPLFVAPKLEANKIQEYTGVRVVIPWTDEDGPLAALTEALAGLIRGKVVGAEYRYMRLLERDLVERAAAPAGFADIGGLIADMRMHKDEAEIAIMQRAAEIADIGAAACKAAIRPGATELEVMAACEKAMKDAGAASIPFGIVLSGPNGALPHGHTSDYVLKAGELVICDIGAEYQGYMSDITRTFPVGAPDPRLAEIYQVVYDAQKHAREHIRPGMTGAQVDELCRSVISARGYGEYFIHRTGHGLGMEVHEEPYIVKTNQTPLEPGNSFTVEPGVYLPGVGGVRIEDDVVITSDGVRVLTAYPRELGA